MVEIFHTYNFELSTIRERIGIKSECIFADFTLTQHTSTVDRNNVPQVVSVPNCMRMDVVTT